MSEYNEAEQKFTCNVDVGNDSVSSSLIGMMKVCLAMQYVWDAYNAGRIDGENLYERMSMGVSGALSLLADLTLELDGSSLAMTEFDLLSMGVSKETLDNMRAEVDFNRKTMSGGM